VPPVLYPDLITGGFSLVRRVSVVTEAEPRTLNETSSGPAISHSDADMPDILVGMAGNAVANNLSELYRSNSRLRLQSYLQVLPPSLVQRSIELSGEKAYFAEALLIGRLSKCDEVKIGRACRNLNSPEL
jgi:hypothetical protein